MHCLIVMLTDFQAGTFSMRDVLGVTRPPKFEEFLTFLRAMEVYGCGYMLDIDYKLYTKRQKQTHKQDMIDQLSQLLRLYELLIYLFST